MNTHSVWDKLSKHYETLWVQKYSLTPTRKRVLALLSKEKFSSLLDVGCGTGQLLREIKAAHPHAALTGMDKSGEMIRLAREKAPELDFQQATAEELCPETKFDCITCCHSFPYYTEKTAVLKKLSGLLQDNGRAIFVQASVNSFFDRLILLGVEQTAEKADYLSRDAFIRLASPYFTVEETFLIRERWFMPSICGFVLRKKAKPEKNNLGKEL